MKEELSQAVKAACKELFDVEVEIALTRPDERFGDFAANVALQLGKQLGKNPREIGEALAEKLRGHELLADVQVAGPGFLNLKLTDESLWKLAREKPSQAIQGQQVLTEFGDANPFKEMHLGHLYTTIMGDALARLFEVGGADVRRVSYHGDVGMHVARAIWGMKQALGDQKFSEAAADQIFAQPLGFYYAQGAQASDDPSVAEEIKQINEHVYKQDDPEINQLYKWGREKSFEAFDRIFEELGVPFERRYLESEATPIGLRAVKDHAGKVFKESDGAIIYDGEKKGLHKRVFINSRGLPTYEAKDLGLVELKDRDYPNADRSIIITAHEQTEYFKVMLAALSEFQPELAAKTTHIAHGFLSLTTGKMSSRTGQVYTALSLMNEVKQAAKTAYPESDIQHEVYLAALKYAFLKNRIGGDIVFDVKESVALDGNSGPYIQYAHARSRSILAKAKNSALSPQPSALEADERSLLRKIGEYPEVIQKAMTELMPHHVCTYLYELAQTFNSFYEKNRVIGDPRQNVRLQLVTYYADTLKDGLKLLGIHAPDKM